MGWKRALGVRVPSARTAILGRRGSKGRGKRLGCLVLLAVLVLVFATVAALKTP